MKKTIIALAAAAVLASSGAWAATVTCQRIGDATTCSDGTIAQPLGGGRSELAMATRGAICPA
jgi:hypothetical protein